MKPNRKRVGRVLALLDREYGTDDRCYLFFGADHELLVAVMLSAQCTDARVNMVTPELFRRFPTVDALADADVKELEEVIHSVGFYHDKARNIKACMTKLRDDFGGKVPERWRNCSRSPASAGRPRT